MDDPNDKKPKEPNLLDEPDEPQRGVPPFVWTLLVLALIIGIPWAAAAMIWGPRGALIEYLDTHKGKVETERSRHWYAKVFVQTHRNYFAPVTAINAGGVELSPRQLGILGDFETLKDLNLSKTNITDEGLVEVASLPALEKLDLSGTKVTDAGLAHLANLPALRDLNLASTAVTDAGLAQLARLPGLSNLTLVATKITDAGLAHLKGKQTLVSLVLDHTAVTSAGMENLAGLQNLTALSLNSTAIDDKGLAHFQSLPRLLFISMAETKVTNEGLPNLKGPGARIINLKGSGVTAAAAAEFVKTMPPGSQIIAQ
jgi:Leucine-rich repeat (LRR) protein